MLENEILNEIDRTKLPELLEDLVSMRSDDSEQEIVDYLVDRMEKLGADYEITEVAPNRQNLTASVGDGDRSLILNSHMDTVPPGDMENWQVPPLKLTRKGKDLVGLGACDAKGSLASMLTAFEFLARNAGLIHGRLILQAVCCEETGGRGTLAEVKRGVIADAAIIGEPTSLVPMIGHKGALGVKLHVFGKAAHGSSPEEGINAISRMARLIRSLDVLAEDISTRRDKLFGSGSLAVTQISGGRAANVIPDNCVIRLDRRLIPGDTVKDALDEISRLVDNERSMDSSLSVSIEKVTDIEPCSISPDESIVKAVTDSITQVTGVKREISGFTACCDMWCLVRGAGIPTMIMGPGDLSMAHKANESISVDSLYEAAKIYSAIAVNYLNPD